MAVIYCFSATGNSLYVAKQIGKEINANIMPMREKKVSCEEDVIGFVFPVYYWGLPCRVDEFIKGLTIKSQNPYIFAVSTYGGDAVGVFGAVEQILAQKGYHLSYAKGIKAVENYIPGFKVNNTQKVEDRFQEKLSVVCEEVKNKAVCKFGKYTFMNKCSQHFFPAKKDKACDQYFNVADKCNGCGICSKVCPVGNILLVGQKPQFKHQCEHCMACVHACPQVAIEWKKGTVGKERFRNRHISLKELIAFNDNSKNSRQNEAEKIGKDPIVK